MTSHDRALHLLRELMQTGRDEFAHYPTRAGLRSQPSPEDIERAQELLVAIVDALESERGSSAWTRVHEAWTGSRQRLGAPPARGLVSPPPPAWLGGLPPAPSLSDPAPGTPAAAGVEQRRDRFVPQAPPALATSTHGASTASRDAPEPRMQRSQTPPTPPISPLRELLAADARAKGPPNAVATPAPRPGVYGESYAVGPAPTPAVVLEAPLTSMTPSHGVRVAAHHLPAMPAVAPTTTGGGSFEATGWTVSRYAAFCAACSASPNRAAETAREYGIPDEHVRRQLDDYFAERFDRDADEQSQWERLVSQFRDRLRSVRG